MNGRSGRPSPLGVVLENILARSGLNRRVGEQKILDSWKRIVGEGIAEQTRAIRIQNRILQVRVSNSVWMQQLQFMKGRILKKIKGEAGTEDLEDLRFFIGELEAEGENEEKGQKKGKEEPIGWEDLTETERSRIKKEVEALSDPEMRRVFEKVFARGLAAQKSKEREEKVGR